MLDPEQGARYLGESGLLLQEGTPDLVPGHDRP